MKLILLSGGSGKRLWPLSNESRSKQFLKVLENEVTNDYESMVQRVWRQLSNLNLTHSTVIATGVQQVDILHNQLNNQAKLVVEPERRDTFAAIALTASYLYTMEGTALDCVIGVLPVDPFVETQFFSKVKELEQVLNKTNADLGLIGITPTHPSSKYGYIVPSVSEQSQVMNVNHFKEKPDETTAKDLIINKGALWNSGVFAFKLEYIISLLVKMGLPIHYEELLKQYHTIPKNSFDYEVVEKANSIITLSYDGYWKDLGTWNTLTDEMGSHINGLGNMCSDSKNTHIINELDIPVTVLGIKNAVVVASPDGILVTDKQKSPHIKKYINSNSQEVRYRENHWGTFKTLEMINYDDYQVSTSRLTIFSEMNLNYQMNESYSEIHTVIRGEGELVLEGQVEYIQPGSTITIPEGVFYSIKADKDLELIVVRKGKDISHQGKRGPINSWNEIKRLVKV